ncbi:MAG: hypothetical protein K8T89_17095, partial [Planctomycetes bacterium]|nr:hypothetical protein [Planctomycetota bacterium]
MKRIAIICFVGFLASSLRAAEPTEKDILDGLRGFYAKTARPDGSFQPGVDPEYRGMSDCAYSDLAAVTYAVTLHKTFGWKLPHEEKTIAFLLSRQKPTGEFVNVAGTVKPDSAEGKTYNTTQALVALRALSAKPKYDPTPIFEDILKEDYKELPAYTTSFFPLAYLCMGKPIPVKADQGVRALMIQDRTGYLNDHIAATFHASHYYHLVGETTPKATDMVDRILADQSRDGSWLLNKPSRDRHATYDAVFTLHHEGSGLKCKQAIEKAAKWAISCRNDDGGFGHFPGAASDADAIYFNVGTLVMAGVLKPIDPLPADAHLLSWGHLMPIRSAKRGREIFSANHDGPVSTVAFWNDDKSVLTGSFDGTVRLWNLDGKQLFSNKLTAQVGAVAVRQASPVFAAGAYDGLVRVGGSKFNQDLKGHRGAVLAVAFHPKDEILASGGMDGSVYIWRYADGALHKKLAGHRSWVNSLAFAADGT